MKTERYRVGRYWIDEPRPGRFRVYQGQPDGSIRKHKGDAYPDMESALRQVTRLQHQDLLDMAQDLRTCIGRLQAFEA